MRARLAIYNFGMFREPEDSQANQGFRDREDANFAAAERAFGFVGRSGYAGEAGRASWGERVYPRFYVERGDGGSPSTLSLWDSLESLFAFAYTGMHARALARASDWFVEKRWPAYVLWWVEANRAPDWREGVARFELLHDLGPTPQAFDFKSPFDEAGRAATLDKDAVKRASLANLRPPVIRDYEPSDLDAVIAVFHAAIRDLAGRDYSQAQVDAWAQTDRDAWAPRRLSRPTWVAMIEQSVVGFADLEPDGHLDMMFVHPAHQKLGVATALLQTVETSARAKGLARVFVEASVAARRFFERRGYAAIGEQVVEKRGQHLNNYRMEKVLI